MLSMCEPVIVIPIYAQPSAVEKKLIKKCTDIFSSRAIRFVSPKNFSLNLFTDITHVHFDPRFFENKLTYSKLLCSREFYKAFSDFDFIQVIQLDCYVFEDRLNEFMSMGFDYIGAPWMKNGFEGKPEPKLWKVGNGGFSLRRVRSFLSIINKINDTKKGVLPVFQDLRKGLVGKIKNSGIRNNLRHYIKNPPGEDIFWAHYVTKIFDQNEFKVADTLTAAHYSFEVLPQFLFDEITKGKLPMGCHNWINQNPKFWSSYISS